VGCKHRVKVKIHHYKYTQGHYVGGQEVEGYICGLGLNRDRNPNFCPYREELK
jgi:hypothetical protein